MHFAKLTPVFQFISQILKEYPKLDKTQANTLYRIADVEISSSTKVIIVVQVIGKSNFFRCTPEEIVSDDKFLEGFSKKDIRTITYYASQQKKNVKYKIIAQEFCEKRYKLLFKLKDIETNEIILKTAGEILLNKNMIGNLSQEDLCNISYIAGHEHSNFESSKGFGID